MPQKELAVEISYMLPTIGSIRIELRDQSAELYEFLREQGETVRLTGLKHLGVLQQHFPGILHTRWDYTVAMLYVIEQLTA